jgi:hypothetical protein
MTRVYFLGLFYRTAVASPMKPLLLTKTIQQSLQVVWAKRRRLFWALAPSGLGLACLHAAVENLKASAPQWLLVLLLTISSGLLFTVFAVACHRIVLLDGAGIPRYGLRAWSMRETRFLGWSVVGSLSYMAITLILVMMLTFLLPATGVVLDPATPEASVSQIFMVIGFAAMIPGSYVMARLAVLLPATAIGERHNMEWAWKLTSGNGWRLTLLIALLPTLLSLLGGLADFGEHFGLKFLAGLLSYAVVAVEVAVLSNAFRFLTMEPSDGIEV